MAKIKCNLEGIDEAALLQSIYEQDNPPPQVVIQPKEPEVPNEPEVHEITVEPAVEQPEKPETPKEVKEAKEPAKRKRNQVDYSSMFLQRNEIKERSCVYISKRVHSTISEIVRVIANRDVSVGGYIDVVLMQHLEAHKDEINELYKRERKDLIEL